MSDGSAHKDRILQFARQAAVAAGDVLRQYYGHASVEEKESHNLVTQADLAAEALVSDMIQAAFPSHSLWREESGATGGIDDEHLWVIDPLDGTNNYAHGVPHFSVSIAYCELGISQVGVVYDPLRPEMFAAIRGVGAWLNDRPIHVSTRATIPHSLICTGFYYDRGIAMERTLAALHRLFENRVRGVRRTGGAALDLCWVACGRLEGFFEYQLAPWDYAAGSLIVQEAGGICLDRVGRPLDLNSQSMIAANPHVASELLEIVRWQD